MIAVVRSRRYPIYDLSMSGLIIPEFGRGYWQRFPAAALLVTGVGLLVWVHCHAAHVSAWVVVLDIFVPFLSIIAGLLMARQGVGLLDFSCAIAVGGLGIFGMGLQGLRRGYIAPSRGPYGSGRYYSLYPPEFWETAKHYISKPEAWDLILYGCAIFALGLSLALIAWIRQREAI